MLTSFRLPIFARWLPLISVCVAGIVGLPLVPTWNKVSAADTPSSNTALRVNAGKPARKTLVRRTEQPGQIDALEQAPLFAKVSGFITKIHADIGDRVKKGQAIADISVPELTAELNQKKSLVDSARAEVEQASAAIKVAEAAKAAAEAAVVEVAASKQRATAEHTRSKSELERISSLFSSQAVTQKSVDESKNRQQAADSAVHEVDAKVKAATAAVAQKTAAVDLARADHASTLAKLKVAEAEQVRLEALHKYTTISAPFDGIVTVRNVDLGHLTHAGKTQSDVPLFVVVDAHIVRVFVEIPESDAAHVNPGNEASVRIPGLGNLTVTATVARTSWALHPSTRTLRAEIHIPNPDGQYRPGMYVYADVKVAERKNVISLPKAAILAQDTRLSCFVVGANTIVRKPITTGIRSGDDVEILSGLTGDEIVIQANAASYREGQKVEIAVKK